MFNPLESTQPGTFSGSEGRTVILDSEDFLPDKITDEESKQHIQFTFGSKNDMINYLMMKEVVDYSKRATAFFQSAIKGKIDYRDEDKIGKIIGKYILVDSIKAAQLISFEYSQDLKDVLSDIYSDGKIDISGFRCVLKYTNGISLFMRKYVYDSMGIFDYATYMRNVYNGNPNVIPGGLLFLPREITDIEAFKEMRTNWKAIKDREELLQSARELQQLMNQN